MTPTPQPPSNRAPGIRTAYFAHPTHGPLPAILIGLTVITGMVDALSILALGRVFVANMTGNVVFIGFAIGGADEFSLLGSLLALLGFALGAAAGGVVITRIRGGRGVLLRNVLIVQFLLMMAALIIAVTLSTEIPSTAANVIVLLMAFGLGFQNSIVRELAVPDMTTTVLTMAITGIGADLRKRDSAAVLRRSLSVLSMFLGAVAGTVLVRSAGVVPTLSVIAGSYLLVAALLMIVVREDRPWQRR